MNMSKDFLWGVATSSYQVEGASHLDGRGESIWDLFCRTPGKVYNNHNGDVSCDQYHRYPEDIALMHDIGIQAYRFSLSWPRIQPSGSGAANPKGLDYYKRLIDCLLQHNIMPVITLYHWDLPAPLQESGGWAHRDTAYRFREYSEICFKHFAAVVPMWITLNEPFCVAYLGYCTGDHAPGHTSVPEMVAAIHHLNVAHGLAVEAYRGYGAHKIGITLNLAVVRPATNRPKDIEKANRLNDYTRMYLWPLFGKGYPEHYVEYARTKHNAPLPIADNDMAQIAQKIDFLGFNYYFEQITSATAPEHEQNIDVWRPHWQSSWEATTEMGWPITPTGLYRHLQWIKNEIGDIPIYITENGCATPDTVSADGRVHDSDRINYIRTHLQQLARAQADGIQVAGYFLWSFIDNFEWGYGYTKRFGIVYCNYATLARIPKDSYYFYRDCIAGYVE